MIHVNRYIYFSAVRQNLLLKTVLRTQVKLQTWENTEESQLAFFFFFLIFIRVQLLYNVVLVSTLQKSESATSIHTSPLFCISFQFWPPQNCSQHRTVTKTCVWSQHTALSSPGYTVGSR